MINQIENKRQFLILLETFCAPHAEFFNSTDDWYNDCATRDIHFFCASYRGGTKLLDQVGEVFGRHDWTSRPVGKTYLWSKKVGDFTLHCHDAANVPQEQERPVAVGEWPVLLADVTSDEELEVLRRDQEDML